MTESPASASPRRFRLQLSLRTLLVLMALVGVGLAVFRWPWVETTTQEVRDKLTIDPRTSNVHYRFELRTTYRRDWRGQPVKNGPAQIWRDGQLWHDAHFYEGELNGLRRVYNQSGQLIMEGNYRGGLLQGSFRAGDGTAWLWEGNYENDTMQGRWRGTISRRSMISDERSNYSQQPPRFSNTFFFPDGSAIEDWDPISLPKDPIVVESEWKAGQRQGKWIWKTLDGEVLNTAEYDENRLVAWNGQPVVEQFRQWLLSPDVDDPQLCATLFAKDQPYSILYDIETGDFSLSDQARIHIAHPGWCGRHAHLHELSLQPATGLCEFALENGCAFDYRYGGLWLVPRADPEPPFVDPTGVSQIHWPQGSVAAREWEQVIDVTSNAGHVAACVAHLLAETSIPIQVFEVDDWVEDQSNSSRVVFRRRRCEALGFVLYRTGCRCELRDGTLHILPRPGRTGEERFRNPLN